MKTLDYTDELITDLICKFFVEKHLPFIEYARSLDANDAVAGPSKNSFEIKDAAELDEWLKGVAADVEVCIE